jgi:hypothetical protein
VHEIAKFTGLYLPCFVACPFAGGRPALKYFPLGQKGIDRGMAEHYFSFATIPMALLMYDRQGFRETLQEHGSRRIESSGDAVEFFYFMGGGRGPDGTTN